MKKNLEVIFDSKPNGGCGCNCGCEGSSVVEDMNNLITNLKEHTFFNDLSIDALPISSLESNVLMDKINALLNNTNAAFRVSRDNADEILSDMLPIVALEGTIITAYGVPTLNEVLVGVEKSFR